jgi:hypothetical protein
LIKCYEDYPEKLGTVVGNYLLPEYDKVVAAAEASLRPVLKPIEQRQVRLFDFQIIIIQF